MIVLKNKIDKETKMEISKTIEPWDDDDLFNDSDYLVGSIFQLAQQSYYSANDIDRKLLIDLMTRIAKNKPTFAELCVDIVMVKKWYNLLLNTDVKLRSTTQLVLLSSVQDALEDMLGIDAPTFEEVIL